MNEIYMNEINMNEIYSPKLTTKKKLFYENVT